MSRTLASSKRLVRLYRDDHGEHFERFVGRGVATGTVYFIQGGKYVKIGYTEQHVNGRLAGIQTGCPFRLRVLATIPGDTLLERSLHSMFGPWRMHGEWFRLAAPGLLQIIERVNAGETI